MLIIDLKQLALLQASMDQALRGQLLQQIRRDHPGKAQGRDDAALHQYIDVMLSFCKAKRIERLPTIQRLFNLQLRHGFHPRLPLALQWPLEQFAFDEAVRLDRFEQALEGRQPFRVIDLNTPLSDIQPT